MYVHAYIAMSSSVGSVAYGVLNREVNTLLQFCCSSSSESSKRATTVGVEMQSELRN